MLKLKSNSAAQTVQCGKKFSKILKEGDVVILEGALGGGKTTFVKGVLKGLGFRKRVLSPSFTLLRQYQTRKFMVNHLDLYRLEKKDIFALGMDDILDSWKTVTLIEWGDRLKEDLDKYLRIQFSFLSENKRRLIFSKRGYHKGKFRTIEEIRENDSIRG